MSVVLRDANPLDAGAMAGILHGFNCETEWMPDLHSGAEALSFCGSMIERGWVRVAEHLGRVAGFCARDGGDIVALYVRSDLRGQGIGRALLQEAQTCQPELALWTFVANTGAQRFYERAGFHCVRRGDGSRNDEGFPDLFYEWRAAGQAQERTSHVA